MVVSEAMAGLFIFSERQEHAPPLAEASVETGVEVHDTDDVADKAASGGCCASSCWTLLSWRDFICLAQASILYLPIRMFLVF